MPREDAREVREPRRVARVGRELGEAVAERGLGAVLVHHRRAVRDRVEEVVVAERRAGEVARVERGLHARALAARERALDRGRRRAAPRRTRAAAPCAATRRASRTCASNAAKSQSAFTTADDATQPSAWSGYACRNHAHVAPEYEPPNATTRRGGAAAARGGAYCARTASMTAAVSAA